MVKLGSIATKTIGLYLMTTGIAVSMALIFGYIFNLSGYEGDVEAFTPTTRRLKSLWDCYAHIS